jgi:hypothetical protein
MMGVFESNFSDIRRIVALRCFSDIRRIVALRCLKCNRVFLYAQNTITVSNLNARGKKIFLLIFVIMALCALFVYVGLG